MKVIEFSPKRYHFIRRVIVLSYIFGNFAIKTKNFYHNK